MSFLHCKNIFLKLQALGNLLMPPMMRFREDDQRLIAAAIPVLLFFALSMNSLYNSYIVPALATSTMKSKAEWETQKTRIYPVLVKQWDRVQQKENEIRALSDVDAGGQGGITAQYGFHSLTLDDELELTKQRKKKKAKQQNQQKQNAAQNHGSNVSTQTPAVHNSKQEKNRRYHIPSNYHFRQDFELRYDGSSLFSIAREKLAGFDYFRKMLRKIKANFAPPGVNYMYYDQSGYVINQPIHPQVVNVAFALDQQGNISDVRKLSSLGQKLIDEACLNSLRNQNFGIPPKEVFQRGNVFGIRFVFPALQRK